MHRFLYWSLAWQSIQKSRRITVPFIAGSSLMVMMLYSLLSLSVSSVFGGTFGETTMLTTLNLGVHVVRVLYRSHLSIYQQRLDEKPGTRKTVCIPFWGWKSAISCASSFTNC